MSRALHTSSFLMERYLEAADKALNVAIANGPQPQSVKKRYSYKDERAIIDDRQTFAADGPQFFGSWTTPSCFQFDLFGHRAGWFYHRFRQIPFPHLGLRFSKPRKDPSPFACRLALMGMGEESPGRLLQAPADKPRVVEFVDRMEPTNTIHIVPYGTGNEQTFAKTGPTYTGTGSAVEWVEVEGPLHEFGLPRAIAASLATCLREKVASAIERPQRVVSKTHSPMRRRILHNFPRAFRRRSRTTM